MRLTTTFTRLRPIFSNSRSSSISMPSRTRRSSRHGGPTYGMISYIDAKIGALREALERTGQFDDTLIIVTADHGERLGEYGLWYMRNFFEGSVRVPLVFHGSGPGGGARRVVEHVPHLDLLPTLDGGPVDGESCVFAEISCDAVSDPNVMIRDYCWKYWYCDDCPPLLFGLAEDLQNQVNLAGEAEHRETLTRFEKLLADRWYIGSLKATILKSQRERMLISYSHRNGSLPIWDCAVPNDPLARYMLPPITCGIRSPERDLRRI